MIEVQKFVFYQNYDFSFVHTHVGLFSNTSVFAFVIKFISFCDFPTPLSISILINDFRYFGFSISCFKFCSALLDSSIKTQHSLDQMNV